MKKPLLLFPLLLLVLAVLLIRIPSSPTSPESLAPTQPTPPPATSPSLASESLPAPPHHPLANHLGDPTLPPEQEPALVLELLQTFRRTTGHFPTAEDNPGLIRQLQHPRGTTPPLLPLHHPRIDHHGALLDPWGTPYFFHHLSRNRLEIRSAGPDREFHTDDDLLLPSQP